MPRDDKKKIGLASGGRIGPLDMADAKQDRGEEPV